MLRKRLALGLISTLMVITLVVAGCAQSSSSPATVTPTSKTATNSGTTPSAPAKQTTKQVLKIGAGLPSSGAYASYGDRATKGIRIAADEINSSGDYPFTIDLVFADSAGDPATAVSAVQKLITLDNVNALMLPISSSQNLALHPLLIQEGIAGIASSGIVAAVATESKGHAFLMQTPTAQLVAAFVKFVDTKLKPKAYFGIYLQTDSGNAEREAQLQALSQTGINVVGQTQVPATITDVSPLVTSIKSSNADTVFLGVVSGVQAKIAWALREQGVKVQLVDTLYSSEDTFKNGGEAVDGMIAFYQFTPDRPSAKTRAFVEKYKQLNNVVPDVHSAAAYDALYAIANASKTAGSTDKAAIRKALAGVNFEGTTGKVQFATDNLRLDPQFSPVRYNHAKGQLEPVPYP